MSPLATRATHDAGNNARRWHVDTDQAGEAASHSLYRHTIAYYLRYDVRHDVISWELAADSETNGDGWIEVTAGVARTRRRSGMSHVASCRQARKPRG